MELQSKEVEVGSFSGRLPKRARMSAGGPACGDRSDNQSL
jgi:hypothetical protein